MKTFEEQVVFTAIVGYPRIKRMRQALTEMKQILGET
jgi:hypothetical protein